MKDWILNCLHLDQESTGCNYKASGFSLAWALYTLFHL